MLVINDCIRPLLLLYSIHIQDTCSISHNNAISHKYCCMLPAASTDTNFGSSFPLLPFSFGGHDHYVCLLPFPLCTKICFQKKQTKFLSWFNCCHSSENEKQYSNTVKMHCWQTSPGRVNNSYSGEQQHNPLHAGIHTVLCIFSMCPPQDGCGCAIKARLQLCERQRSHHQIQ